MARTKSIAQRRHRKILKRASGFKHARKRRVKTAKEALLHAGQYAYVGRKLKKRDLKKLWILRINAQLRNNDLKYSTFIKKMKDNNILLNRKMLSEIATNDPNTFVKIIESLK